MALTETTRELLFDKIEKIDKEIDLLESCIERGNITDFADSWKIEIDLHKRSREILKKALIKNDFEFEF